MGFSNLPGFWCREFRWVQFCFPDHSQQPEALPTLWGSSISGPGPWFDYTLNNYQWLRKKTTVQFLHSFECLLRTLSVSNMIKTFLHIISECMLCILGKILVCRLVETRVDDNECITRYQNKQNKQKYYTSVLTVVNQLGQSERETGLTEIHVCDHKIYTTVFYLLYVVIIPKRGWLHCAFSRTKFYVRKKA